jgi:uracil-DNA glycosylase
MLPEIPTNWRGVLGDVTRERWYRELDAFLDGELAAGREILPARADVFNALRLTPPGAVRVVLLGQDPYPTPGHAHGLCFSVRPHVRPLPRSLQNVHKELRADLGGDNFATPAHGCLESWARQGVLLLNTVLTVRAGGAGSHRGRGWEIFTDRVIAAVDALPGTVVFVLWGNQARAKRGVITGARHRIVESAHPSPLSARLFFGCKCFSAVNRHLAEAGRGGIDWRLAEAAGADAASAAGADTAGVASVARAVGTASAAKAAGGSEGLLPGF